MSTSDSMRWVELMVRVPPGDVDAVAGLLGSLAEYGAAGVSIEPAILVSDSADFEYELLDAPSTVRCALAAPLPPGARRALRRRLDALPLSAPLPRLRFAPVEQRDWSEEWKRSFEVLHVGRRLVLCPSWERYEARPGELVIVLDPGRAFGTGQHATTRLCLEALERCVYPGDAVVDVGTGSGVLAIAAAKLGAASVRAVDVDAETVPVARENVGRNEVEGVVRLAAGSLGDAWPWPEAAEGSADVVVANISSPVLVALMPVLAATLRPGGRLIASGFIAANAAEVEAAALAAGLSLQATEGEAGERARDGDDEWRRMVASKAGPERSR